MNGVSNALARGVLYGRFTCRIGKSHKAAVLMGLKDGEIVEENGDE